MFVLHAGSFRCELQRAAAIRLQRMGCMQMRCIRLVIARAPAAFSQN
jgi:hypothetical protein